MIAAPILAQTSASSGDLQKEYGNKVLTLRQPYLGEHLHFDAAGKPATGITPDAWTLGGQLRVKDISLENGVVHIRGRRLFLFLDPETKQLRDLSTVTENDAARKLFSKRKVDEWASKKGKIEIELECGLEKPEMADVTKAMDATFLGADEPLTNAVPDSWKACLKPNAKEKSAPAPLHSPADSLKVGGGVSAPHAVYSPDPHYSELAKQAGYQAVVVLWMVVGSDGLPLTIRIQTPAGMGLDEKAIEAVQTWKFDPAMKDGHAVAVQINVEVSFKLY